MKIKFRDRLILFFGAVVTALSGAMLFVFGLQLQGLISEMAVWTRVVCILAGLLLIAFGVYLFLFPRRISASRKDFVVQKTDTGELRIAVKAIENLVQKCIDLHEEIQVRSMQILNGREGVVVDLFVSLANNISIPMSVASLQKQIKQYLGASTGIEVKEVRVSVESTEDEPQIEQAAEKEEQEEEAALQRAEEKLPLHQRLFGRQNQPAIMPEPPQEEGQETESDEPAETPDWDEEAQADKEAEDGEPQPVQEEEAEEDTLKENETEAPEHE